MGMEIEHGTLTIHYRNHKIIASISPFSLMAMGTKFLLRWHTACCAWSHDLRPKESFMLVWRCHQLLSGFLSIGFLLRVLHLSAYDKGDNEVKPGAVHGSHGIYYLMAEENFGMSIFIRHIPKAKDLVVFN